MIWRPELHAGEMQIHRFISTMNTAGGTGSLNTQNLRGGLCRQIIIQAGTSSTNFSANLTDDDALAVRTYSTISGGILIDDNRVLPVKGTYTMQVTGATADGRFTCVMLVEE